MKKLIFTLMIICFGYGALSAQVIGNNGEGTSHDHPGGCMTAIKYQCSQNMTAALMKVKIEASGSGNIQCAIYADDNGVPGTLLRATNELTNPGTGWKTFTLTSGYALTSGTWYHLALWCTDNYGIYYTANGVGTPWRAQTYGTWPSPFGTVDSWPDGTYCIYATVADAPAVTTTSISSITSITASSGGTVTSDGGASVTARGVCWATISNPIITNSHTTDGSGTGNFTSSLTSLTQNTTYYVRAYATNSVGTSYGSNVSFTTLAPPTVTTTAISSITSITASSGGTVTSDGGATVTARGVCWNTATNPTTANYTAPDGSGGTGNFTSSLTSLTQGTTYYVRAYATNSVGTSYGSNVSFTTLTTPTVTTTSISSITANTASSGGSVTSDGGANVTARGVCWATTSNPINTNSHTSDGTGTDTFTSSLTSLTASTHYYVRAYATNSVGTAYGSELDFTTTNPVITLGNNAEGTTPDSPGTCILPTKFQCTQSMTATLMYVKVAATASGNMKCAIYSDNGGNPSALLGYTNERTNVGTGWQPFTLTSGVALTSGSYYHLTLWSSSTYSVYCTTGGVGSPYRSDTYSSWPDPFGTPPTAWENTYCIYTTGTAGGASAPAVTTTDISNIGTTSASSGGNVTSDGGATVTARGVCWNTATSPTTANYTAPDGSGGTGTFTSSLTGLTQNTTYHVRAYATNSVGTAYGSELDFTTTNPVITLGNYAEGTTPDSPGTCILPTKFQCTQSMTATLMYVKVAATASGNMKCAIYSDNGGNPNALLGYTNERTNVGTGWQPFTLTSGVALTSGSYYHLTLWSSSTYSIYCTTGGVGSPYRSDTYSSWPDPFGTPPTAWENTYCIYTTGTAGGASAPAVTTTDITGIGSTSASSGGEVTSDGGATVTARGVCWNTATNPTTANDTTSNGTGTGVFTSSITGLTQNTLYHVRAYATNSAGTAYGSEKDFTTNPTGGTTHYIATAANGGSNSNSGTSGSPWLTLAYACEQVETSGDVIHVNAGTYNESEQCVLAPGVSIEGVGVTSNIVSTYHPYEGWSGWYDGFIMLNSDTEGTNGNQTISNIKLDGSNLTAHNAIFVGRRSNVKIHDVTIVNFQWNAVKFWGRDGEAQGVPPTTYSTGNELYNCIITNCSTREGRDPDHATGTAMIEFCGQDSLLIHDNTLDQTSRAQGDNGNIISTVSGGNGGDDKGVQYYNNVSTKPVNEGGCSGCWNFHLEVWNTRGGMHIHDNQFLGGGTAIDMAGYYSYKGSYDYSWSVHDNSETMDSQFSTSTDYNNGATGFNFEGTVEYANIYNNYFKNLPLGVTWCIKQASETESNINVYNNVFESMGFGSGNWGIVMAFYASISDAVIQDINIYNNVITNPVGGAIAAVWFETTKQQDGGGGTIRRVYIRNNIIQNMGLLKEDYGYLVFQNLSNGTISNIYSQYNLLYNNYNNNAANFRTGSASLTSDHHVNQSPLFVAENNSNFHLQSSSPARGAGTTSLTTTDKDGVAWGSPPSIGAYEYVAAKGAGSVNKPTAIPELTEDNGSFIVYPNPVKDKLTIALKEDNKQGLLKLYDIKGIKLYEGILTGNTILDMSSYASGLYFLHVRLASGLKVVKVIK